MGGLAPHTSGHTNCTTGCVTKNGCCQHPLLVTQQNAPYRHPIYNTGTLYKIQAPCFSYRHTIYYTGTLYIIQAPYIKYRHPI